MYENAISERPMTTARQDRGRIDKSLDEQQAIIANLFERCNRLEHALQSVLSPEPSELRENAKVAASPAPIQLAERIDERTRGIMACTDHLTKLCDRLEL